MKESVIEALVSVLEYNAGSEITRIETDANGVITATYYTPEGSMTVLVGAPWLVGLEGGTTLEDTISKIIGWVVVCVIEAVILSGATGRIWWFVPHNYMGKPDSEIVQSMRVPAVILLGIQVFILVWWLRIR